MWYQVLYSWILKRSGSFLKAGWWSPNITTNCAFVVLDSYNPTSLLELSVDQILWTEKLNIVFGLTTYFSLFREIEILPVRLSKVLRKRILRSPIMGLLSRLMRSLFHHTFMLRISLEWKHAYLLKEFLCP